VFFINYGNDEGRPHDDRHRGDLRRLLAATTHLLRRHKPLPRNHPLPPHPARLPDHLLGGDEQLDVQSDHVLLDERTVRFSALVLMVMQYLFKTP